MCRHFDPTNQLYPCPGHTLITPPSNTSEGVGEVTACNVPLSRTSPRSNKLPLDIYIAASWIDIPISHPQLHSTPPDNLRSFICYSRASEHNLLSTPSSLDARIHPPSASPWLSNWITLLFHA
ncbi:hypothetical protein AB1N83_006749 [Pleurotus pulmonarius]